MLSTRQVVNVLKEQGHKIEYRERTDGGIFITKIDGKKYSRSEGNKVGRALANAPISERKSSQLKYATKQQKAYKKAGYIPKAQRPPKGTRRRRADSELTQEELLKRQLGRTQRAWRETSAKGIISAKKVKYIIEHEETREKGINKALALLKRLEEHAKGYAYKESVDALIERLHIDWNFANDYDKNNFKEIIDIIEKKKNKFKEEWLKRVLNAIYDYENNYINSGDLLLIVIDIVK